MYPLKLITPDSISDPNYEDFEFVIEWLSTKEAYYQRMFTNWETSESVSNDILNEKSKTKIRNLPISEQREIELYIEDISLNDLKEYLTILKAIWIQRVYKDGTRERYSISGQQTKYIQTDVRYNLTITLIPYQRKLPQ